jgi:hypothetical protein
MTDTSSGGGTARMTDYRVFTVERTGPRCELCLCTMLSQSKRPSAFSERNHIELWFGSRFVIRLGSTPSGVAALN